MKVYLYLLLLLSYGYLLQGQTYREISTGNQYTQQVYFELGEGEPVAIPNESWDIAFTAFGLQDAGIHINESTPLSTENAPPAVELYLAPTNVFTDVIQESAVTDRIFNTEESWTYGALNNTRDVNNPLDYGWGAYNPSINQVIGKQVFVLKMRDGSFKKFAVDSLVLNTYYLRHADLDGSNELAATVNKSDFADGGLAFFSFSSNSTIDVIPEKWDLVFCRYNVPLNDGQGGTIDYDVTGILNHPSVKVAEIRGIATNAVNETSTLNFEDRIDVIGSDWKGFDFASGWFLRDSLSYVVKMPNDQLYKLVFIDFSGSGTGTATFEQSDLGILSSNVNLAPEGASWAVYPNPILDHSFTLSLDLATSLGVGQLNLYNALGQKTWTYTMSTEAGFNAYTLQLPNTLAAGQYWLRLSTASGQLTQAIIIK